MAKKTKNDYGIYSVKNGGKTFTLVKGGFKNSYECEKWLRNEIKKSEGSELGGEFAILSLRRKFTLKTKTHVSVKFVDIGLKKFDGEAPASKTAPRIDEVE